MKPSQPSQTMTAVIFEIVQHEGSTLTVDGKLEVFVHGEPLDREVLEATIDSICKRLRGQLRDDLPR